MSTVEYALGLSSSRKEQRSRTHDHGNYSAKKLKHSVARLNDVHAFGYNSARSEWIWMKFGTLRIHWPEPALTDFGRDPRISGSGSAIRFFVFFVR